jgi:hypothetical protein
MWEQALEIASHLTHPIPLVAFAIVLAAIVFVTSLRSRKRGNHVLLRGHRMATTILVAGLLPLGLSTWVQWKGIYHIRCLVLRPDNQPATDAEMRVSAGAEIKKSENGWEIDVLRQTLPTDRRVSLFASIKESFLAGSTTIVLDEDYYPHAAIYLTPLPSAEVRGIVKDERDRGIPHARVFIVGYTDATTTDEFGNFNLSAHAADSQMITIRAEKNGISTQEVVPAGATAELTLRNK